MSSVFFTDTDCEMLYTDAESLGMNVIGMPYTIKGQEYVYDFGKNIDIKKFYKDMRDGEIVTTSALNPQDYILLDFRKIRPLLANVALSVAPYLHRKLSKTILIL